MSFFLRADPASGTYATLGGPQGRLVIEGGNASSLSAIHPGRQIVDLDVRRVDLAALVAEIRLHAGTGRP